MPLLSKRRAFLLAVAGAAWLRSGNARTKRYRLAILEFGDANRPSGEMRSFTEQLVQLGLIEGGNLIVDRRYAGGDVKRLAELAAELVALKPDVIFTAGGTMTAQAAKKATSSIPIVFDASNRPVEAGLVATLSHPGGNMTGGVVIGKDLEAKRVQLLGEAMADEGALGFLTQPIGDEDMARRYLAGVAVGLAHPSRLRLYSADSPETYVATFERMARERVVGVAIQNSPPSAVNMKLIAELAAKHHLAAIADGRGFAEAGLLMSYTTSFVELYRRAAEYVQRILVGSNPNDLPLVYASKFDLVINLTTAKALGIRMPGSLLAAAESLVK
jgi:putative ABC transport system substrate-binding protein